jgi:hypothetical protein
MKSKFYFILFISALISLNVIEAQTSKNISGIVTTAGKFQLRNVKVTAQKSGLTAVTDSSGYFDIKCDDKEVLIFSAGGFRDRKVKTGKDNSIEVDLPFTDDVSNFNLAVSGGHITEKNLKSVVDLNLKKSGKDYSKYNSIFALVSSEVYQVRVNGSAIINKEIRSFDTNPRVLLVVNDKIVDDIGFVNPADVKNVEFIDGVSATLYGSKGANGVIKITLK